MAVISLSDHIAKKEREEFPSHTIEFDGPAFPETVSITFRNIIKLSTAERKAFNTVAADLQKDLDKMRADAETLDAAVESGEEVDPKVRRRFEKAVADFDQYDVSRGIQQRQLVILSTDKAACEDALKRLDNGQVSVIAELIVGNGDIEGLATGE